MAFEPMQWAEEHPYETAAIVFGGGLVLLWYFGFFSSAGQTSSDTAASNMAAAYYAAEAAQAQAGTQLNIATENDAAATAQAQIQATAATSIAATQATANTTIATSGYAAQTTQAGYSAAVQTTQANDAMNTNNTNSMYGYLTATASDQAQQNISAMNTIIPTELNLTKGAGGTWGTPFGTFNITPNQPIVLVGPQGPAGPQGPQGIQGIQGVPGAAGTQGPAGMTQWALAQYSPDYSAEQTSRF